MEDDVVVVAVLGVGDKVLDGFGRGFGEEADMDVAVGGVDDGGGACCGKLRFDLLLGVDVAGLLVLNVALGF